jgi:preprotein translocase subunit SecA
VKRETIKALAKVRQLSPEAIAATREKQRVAEQDRQRMMQRLQPRHDDPPSPMSNRPAAFPNEANGHPTPTGPLLLPPRPQPPALGVIPAIAGAEVARNEPCPCGSGKKYKFCHGQLK